MDDWSAKLADFPARSAKLANLLHDRDFVAALRSLVSLMADLGHVAEWILSQGKKK